MKTYETMQEKNTLLLSSAGIVYSTGHMNKFHIHIKIKSMIFSSK